MIAFYIILPTIIKIEPDWIIKKHDLADISKFWDN